jgi:hypothetical protein
VIAQILNRQFVLEQLGEVQKALGKVRQDLKSGKGLSPDVPPIDEAMARSAGEDVGAAIGREKKASSGQPVEAGALRGGVAPLDDFSFVSRDPLISNLQCALEMYFIEKEGGKRLTTTGVKDDSTRGGAIPTVTDQAIKNWHPKKATGGRRVFNKFSTLDAGWVACKLAERWTKKHGPHPFVPAVNESKKVADEKLRLVLVGDWATGIKRAQNIGFAMQNVLQEGKRHGLEQHVIHLGDTYYAGWAEEYQKRFLPHWPVDDWEADQIGSWSLNGNHDMFSGGWGYYDVLLKDKRFLSQKGRSTFSLHNQKWQIVGLDTAYLDADLKDQVDWIKALMDQSDRKFLFLSHHQLFSAWEHDSPHLQNTLAGILARDRVRVWFWGHEHRSVLYKPAMRVQYARCIGHGGVPVYMWHRQKSPYKNPAEWEYRDQLPLKVEPWAYMGFAVLDFEGDSIKVRYINENNKNYKNEQLS